MSALLIGLLVVVASAAMFGLALFGRRPAPQPAMAEAPSPRAVDARAETPPSGALGPAAAASPRSQDGPVALRGADVRVPLSRRLRSGTLLAVSVLGAALLLGAVLSILVVGAILLIA